MKGEALAKKPRKRPGDPELTPEIERVVLDNIVAIGDIETAAVAAGLAKGSLFAILRKGGAGEEPFASFTRRALEAQAKYELRKSLAVERLAQDDTLPASVKLAARTWRRPTTKPSAITPDAARAPGSVVSAQAWEVAAHPHGRPSRIHDLVPLGVDGELIPLPEAIANALRLGVPLKHACAIARLDQSACGDWVRKGDQDLANGKASVYATFATLLAQARAEFVARNVQNVSAQGPTDWRASAWLLERRLPAEFAEQHRIEATVELREELPEDALARAIAEAARRLGAIDVDGVPSNGHGGNGKLGQ